MSMTTSSTSSSQYVTAFFDSREEADAAVERIVDEGIARGDIRIVEGAGASAGVAPERDRGFFEALGDFFMPDEDRHSYAEGLRRGGYLVSLPTTAANRDRVIDILDDEGTVNMEEREESWRSEGWSGTASGGVSGYDAGLATTGATSGAATGTAAYAASGEVQDHDGTIEVVEENLRVGKRDVSHGRVRVRSYVVEEAVNQNIDLHSERVDVQRRAVDRPAAGVDAFRDRTIELEETAEEAVISKEARVVEEIDLNRTVEDRTETVSDTVRRTEVEIEDERAGASRLAGETTSARAETEEERLAALRRR
ncbi:YsnF/AvaK domain-containing protein [Aureimonas populi]|uniref:YsnF/AvaK domain-containing protein n=1 Tax=Aureimonas populi TaxID=1701758 RepID=A0ABW5CNY1_9HYPH|nr:YsnF/AvaK domain-containing protein [Aureimonas populi]